MQVSINELASLVHGRISGPASRSVRAARPLNLAGPDDVSFVENERHSKNLKNCRAGVLIVPRGLAGLDQFAGPDGHTFEFIEVDDPMAAFVVLYHHLSPAIPEPPVGIDPRAAIDPTATIGPGCTIMAFVSVGPNTVVGANCVLHPGVSVAASCRLGDGVVLHSHVTLYRGTLVGHRTIIHANAVLGADGFGYRFVKGQHVKVPQLAHVEVGDDVEIGAGTAIDRGTFQATVIGSGTKIDNLVQIGHNCRIGRHNIICGLVGIAGSCSTGDYVVLAGAAGVADHLHIGDRAVVGAGSGVICDIEPDKRVFGYPARPERDTLRTYAMLGHLPDLWREHRQMKQQLAESTAPPADQERKAG